MRHLLQRLAGAAAAAVLAGAGLVGAAVPAHAAACSGTSGVTVVVDFGSSTTVACAPGDPSSGIGALQAAGFSVDQVQTQPGFVCRINGSPSSDPCVRTPPKSAYWAYYHAARGGSWSYSSLGAGSYDPKPGSVEGWSFGSGGAPGTAPPPAPTRTSEPTPTPKATPTRTTTTTTPRPTSGGTASTPGSGTSDGSGSTSGGGSGSAGRSTPDESTTARPSSRATPSRSRSATPSASPSSSASDSASALPSGSASPTDGPRLAATAATTDEGSGGGAGTLLAGGGLLLLVAGATGWTVWRRRTG